MQDSGLRIAVLGDLTVGKEHVLNLFCQNERFGSRQASMATNINGGGMSMMGSNYPQVHVMLYRPKTTKLRQQSVWVELIAVPSESAHIESRRALYRMSLDAIIVVCDATQPKLWSRTYQWADEALATIAESRPELVQYLRSLGFDQYNIDSSKTNSQPPHSNSGAGSSDSNNNDHYHRHHSGLFAAPVVPVMLVVNRDQDNPSAIIPESISSLPPSTTSRHPSATSASSLATGNFIATYQAHCIHIPISSTKLPPNTRAQLTEFLDRVLEFTNDLDQVVHTGTNLSLASSSISTTNTTGGCSISSSVYNNQNNPHQQARDRDTTTSSTNSSAITTNTTNFLSIT